MRPITFSEFLAAAGLTIEKIKVLRQRDQIALAFGRSDAYQSLGYVELDAVGARLAELLTEKLDRNIAAHIVRDQWGVWSRVVAQAEATKAGPSKFVDFMVVECEDPQGKRQPMTLGTMTEDLRAIRADIEKRTGLIARSYVAVEMMTTVEDVRRNAKRAGYDWSAPFLPPPGSPKLEEILKPYDENMPDRAIVVTTKAQKDEAERARRAGIMARALIEAGLPAMPRGRSQ
jgi:hypothetical protein